MEQPTPLNLIEILHKFSPIINTFVLAGVGWMIAQFKAVNAHLAILNGRMGKVESETANIKETSNQRHDENRNTLERMEDRLKERCRFPDCPPAQQIWGGIDRRKHDVP